PPSTETAPLGSGLSLLADYSLHEQRAFTDQLAHSTYGRYALGRTPPAAAMTDWTNCPDVERTPGKLSGAWCVGGTRMPRRDAEPRRSQARTSSPPTGRRPSSRRRVFGTKRPTHRARPE